MPPNTEGNIFTDPAAGTGEPVTDPKPQADPVFTQKDIDLAAANARADALAEALQNGNRVQADPIQPPTELPPLPTNPLDLLPPDERRKLIESAQIDPAAYADRLGELSRQLSQMQTARLAMPLVNSQAQTLVDLFEIRVSATESRQDLLPKIRQTFRDLLAGKRLDNLVAMPDRERTEELTLRWETARNRVVSTSPAAAPPKVEPTLLSPGQGVSVPTLKTTKALDIPGIKDMADFYKFTPEQLAEIEAEANV